MFAIYLNIVFNTHIKTNHKGTKMWNMPEGSYQAFCQWEDAEVEAEQRGDWLESEASEIETAFLAERDNIITRAKFDLDAEEFDEFIADEYDRIWFFEDHEIQYRRQGKLEALRYWLHGE